MTNALATMRVNYDQIQIKRLEDSNCPMLLKRKNQAAKQWTATHSVGLDLHKGSLYTVHTVCFTQAFLGHFFWVWSYTQHFTVYRCYTFLHCWELINADLHCIGCAIRNNPWENFLYLCNCNKFLQINLQLYSGGFRPYVHQISYNILFSLKIVSIWTLWYNSKFTRTY